VLAYIASHGDGFDSRATHENVSAIYGHYCTDFHFSFIFLFCQDFCIYKLNPVSLIGGLPGNFTGNLVTGTRVAYVPVRHVKFGTEIRHDTYESVSKVRNYKHGHDAKFREIE
jgi:hypothetical protein